VNYPIKISLPLWLTNRIRNVWKRLLGEEEKAPSNPCLSEINPISNGIQNRESRKEGSEVAVNDSASSPSLQSRSQSRPSRKYLTIDHVWAPLLGVLILLMTTSIGSSEIKTGILGTSGVEPLDILALFISLAYISVSLDSTGLLRYLAFLICQKASSTSGSKPNGYKLYLLLYLFFFLLGLLVGNDPVILSGTAFLVYLTRIAGINTPDAWIWGQFCVANISSGVLVSSNPTNLVVVNGFGIGFTEYMGVMVFPCTVSATVTLGVILIGFMNKGRRKVEKERVKNRLNEIKSAFKNKVKKDENQEENLEMRLRNRGKEPSNLENSQEVETSTPPSEDQEVSFHPPIIYIPTHLVPPDVNPRSVLIDPIGAIFGTVVMTLTLILLVVTSVVAHGDVKVYMVSVPAAVICLAKDLAYDWWKWRGEKKRMEKDQGKVTGNGKRRANDDEIAGEGESSRIENEREERERDQESEVSKAAIEEESQRRLNGVGRPGLRGKSESIVQEISQAQEDIELSRIDSTEATIDRNPFSKDQEVSSPQCPQQPRSSSSSIILPTPSSLKPLNPSPLPSFTESKTFLAKLLHWKSSLISTFPTVSLIISRLPLPLLPFSLGFFILIESLSQIGFIDIMGKGLGNVCQHGPEVSVFFISFLGVVVCNVSLTHSHPAWFLQSHLSRRICLPTFSNSFFSSAWRNQHRINSTSHEIFTISIFPSCFTTFNFYSHSQSFSLRNRFWLKRRSFRWDFLSFFGRSTLEI